MIADNVVHVRITAEEIGLAAVAASLVVGSGGWVANWRDRQERRREAAEERRYQNRGEAYTEALQSITHVGGYLQTLRPTIVINAIPQPVVALPGPTEQVRARALVMIYGSASMRAAFDEWYEAARSIEHADLMLTLAQDEAKMGSAPPPTDPQSFACWSAKLAEAKQKELTARQLFAERAAAEFDPPTATGHRWRRRGGKQ